MISSPIVQYYFTQFVGDPTTKPTIKGTFNFTGIALFDSDFYIPGGDGAEWYINQSNFVRSTCLLNSLDDADMEMEQYRQIRNFVFDMTAMNWTNYDASQSYVPAGIHWQVGQVGVKSVI